MAKSIETKTFFSTGLSGFLTHNRSGAPYPLRGDDIYMIFWPQPSVVMVHGRVSDRDVQPGLKTGIRSRKKNEGEMKIEDFSITRPIV